MKRAGIELALVVTVGSAAGAVAALLALGYKLPALDSIGLVIIGAGIGWGLRSLELHIGDNNDE